MRLKCNNCSKEMFGNVKPPVLCISCTKDAKEKKK